MADLFRKDKSQTISTEDELKEAIRVVPSSFKYLVIGFTLAAAAIILWTIVGWRGSTISVTGIYHPTASSEGEILCFPNVSTGKQINTGMSVQVIPDGYDQNTYGSLTGTITWVDSYITSEETMTQFLGEASVVSVFTKNAPCVMVVCKLDPDPASANGYHCTSKKGEDIIMKDGTFVTLSAIISESSAGIGDLF